MNFFSHSKKSESGEVIGTKFLWVHSKGVCEKTIALAYPNLGFNLSNEEFFKILKVLGKFHDLGKYTSFFQNYLLNKKPIDFDKKRHPPIGAMAAYNFFILTDENKALLSFYLIFLHHSNLTSPIILSNTVNDYLNGTLSEQRKDLNQIEYILKNEIEIDEVQTILKEVDLRTLRKGLKRIQINQKSIENYFLFNYLFSLLIEADKLDATDVEVFFPKKIDASWVDLRFGNRVKVQKPVFEKFNIEEIRNFCRSEVVSHLDREETFEYNIFTLTAPTGIGKTMTALDFALKLKQKLEEDTEKNIRIIYALPFVNIIEQALLEYKKTLPGEVAVLGHYQYADIFGQESREIKDEPISYNQLKMITDTWQADVVITSFVQFFETLIGNRNKLLKKFSHYSNSIIILDEVQALRLDQMPLVGASLFYLTKFLKSKIILMTATKPKILELAQSEILSKRGEKIESLELLTSFNEVFKFFTRTQIFPLIDSQINETKDFINEIFDIKWSTEKSCLIVVNTVSRSLDLFQVIKEFLEEKDIKNPIEYLSTNITPKDRIDKIGRIKNLLENNQAPIVIATQVVEAGVDLDFDMGFRDLGPIDSIIQVAGRINRNFNHEKQFSPLFIIDFGDCQKIYKTLSTEQAKNALSARENIKEPEYLELVESYFEGLSERKSFDQFNKIFEAMEKLQYDSKGSEPSVSDFKIIDESKTTQSVYIEVDEDAVFLREKYLQMIRKEIPNDEYQKHYKLKFQQNILGVPNYLTSDLNQINEYDDQILVAPFELVNEYYDGQTGFKRKKSDYLRMF